LFRREIYYLFTASTTVSTTVSLIFLIFLTNNDHLVVGGVGVTDDLIFIGLDFFDLPKNI